jgi:hypothetical protein
VRLTIWSRALTALWALWFTVVLSGPAEIHGCPQHSAHASHMGRMGHGAHDAHSAHEPDTPSRDASQTCTCLGHCCSALPLALPSFGAELRVASVVDVAPAEYAAASAPAPRHRYSLPFANGPPALVVDAAAL